MKQTEIRKKGYNTLVKVSESFTQSAKTPKLYARFNLLGLLRNHAHFLADFGAIVKS